MEETKENVAVVAATLIGGISVLFGVPVTSNLEDNDAVSTELDAYLAKPMVPVVSLQEMLRRTFVSCVGCNAPMPMEAPTCGACNMPVPPEEQVARRKGESKPMQLEFPRPVYMYSRTRDTYRINTSTIVYWAYAPLETLPNEHWNKAREDAEMMDRRQRAEESGILQASSMREVEAAAKQKEATDAAMKKGPRLVT